jgi:hypothetical protein
MKSRSAYSNESDSMITVRFDVAHESLDRLAVVDNVDYGPLEAAVASQSDLFGSRR